MKRVCCRLPVALVAILLLWGCSGLKEDTAVGPPSEPGEKLTFQMDIQPILQQNCVSCHSGARAEGGYDLTSLSGLFGGGSDGQPNAIPGNANSLIVRIIQAGGSHADLVGANAQALFKWVVQDSMGMTQPGVHPEGFMDPASPGFHGKAIEEAGWDMAQCRTCHGSDYQGGVAQASCMTCHVNTPESCSTCHGTGVNPAPPLDLDGNFSSSVRSVGAHQAHLLGGDLADGFECGICHTVPSALHDAGHVDTAEPAEVNFGALARQDESDTRWNGETCNNTYCHGAAEPRWTGGAVEASCGTCHGLPPADPHPQVEACYLCHGSVVDEQDQIVDKSLHVNGQVETSFGHPEGFADPGSPNFHAVTIRELGWKLASCQTCHGANFAGGQVDVSCLTCHTDSPASCTTCHGSAETGPSPPKDLDDHTATTFRGVGAHQAHLSEGAYSRTISCAECHVVPVRLDYPGHLDGTLPAEVTFGALATARGAEPVWDGQTCGNTYCHGGFEAGRNPTVVWTEVGTGQASCGTCHGVPPGPETGHPQNTQCSLCHPRVIDSNLQFVNKSLHINGKVEVGQ